MNAKQLANKLVKAVKHYRGLCDKAHEEDEPLPVIESAIPLDIQKQIAKTYILEGEDTEDPASVVHNVIIGINDKVEALNEAQEALDAAQNDFDCDVDLLDWIADGLVTYEGMEQKLEEYANPEEPEHVSVGLDEDTPGPIQGE